MTAIDRDEMRRWDGDYPFLSFGLDVSKLSVETWILLGECSSKIEHVLGTPLRKDVEERLLTVFLAKGAHGTTAIEGNTLSEEQVKQRIEGSLHLPPSQQYLLREVDNILQAYNSLVRQLQDGVPFHLTPDDLRALNRTVLDGLEVESGVVPGEYREGRVGVGDYLAPPRDVLESMMAGLCDFLNDESWQKPIGVRFVVPILRSIISHLYIAWIHPFGDGNGRTARLIEFDLLIRAEVPISCAHLLSDHYNRTRANYYRALSRARGNVSEFVHYAVEGLRDQLKSQIELIRVQQAEVTWVNYVYSIFREKGADSQASQRIREVAIQLGSRDSAVPIPDVPKLTPWLYARYEQRTPRSLHRDLRVLAAMGLIVINDGAVRGNLDLIKAFLPAKGKAMDTVLDDLPMPDLSELELLDDAE